MMARRWSMVGVLLCGALVGGCVTRPTARVESEIATGATDEAVVLTFTVVARNPGETELPLRMVNYALVIDGRRVFRGRRSAEATLSRKNEQRIDLPVPVKWKHLPEGTSKFRLTGELAYTLPGIFWRAMFDAGFYQPGANFELEGTLDPATLRGG